MKTYDLIDQIILLSIVDGIIKPTKRDIAILKESLDNSFCQAEIDEIYEELHFIFN